MLRKTILATIATALLLGTGTACTGGTEPTPKPNTSPAAKPADAKAPDAEGDTAAPEHPSSREFTKASFDIAWSVYTEDQRDNVCFAIDQLGPDDAKDLMASGVEDQGLMDWTYFTQLISTNCDNR